MGTLTIIFQRGSGAARVLPSPLNDDQRKGWGTAQPVLAALSANQMRESAGQPVGETMYETRQLQGAFTP
jgi:hypothetical protein